MDAKTAHRRFALHNPLSIHRLLNHNNPNHYMTMYISGTGRLSAIEDITIILCHFLWESEFLFFWMIKIPGRYFWHSFLFSVTYLVSDISFSWHKRQLQDRTDQRKPSRDNIVYRLYVFICHQFILLLDDTKTINVTGRILLLSIAFLYLHFVHMRTVGRIEQTKGSHPEII